MVTKTKNQRRSSGDRDNAKQRRQLYEKAKRAKEGAATTTAAKDTAVVKEAPPSNSQQRKQELARHHKSKRTSAPLRPREQPSNARRMPLLAESRVDDEDNSDSSASSLEAESTFSNPPTPKVYLPKTLGSLSSVLTNESSDFDESTLPSMATTDSFLQSRSPTSQNSRMQSNTFTSGTSRSQTLSPSSYGSQTFQSQVNMKAPKQQRNAASSTASSDVYVPSPKHRQKLNQWYQKRLPVLSASRSTNNSQRSLEQNETKTIGADDLTMGDTATYVSYYSDDDDEEDATAMSGSRYKYYKNDILANDDGDYLHTKQEFAYCSIGLTGIQLLVLMMQLAMCGMADIESNPLGGPWPDAYSEFGGKNSYLMITKEQWWRLVSPSLLHVGILHLLANAFCQLEAIALFEREWGSFRWILIYLISSVGCSGMASIFDPDTIAVGSSGALMGLYAAKLAQVTTGMCFTVSKKHMNDAIRLDQLSSVLCGLTLVSMMSCFTYIDWSGHFGGLVSGFLSGMVLFSYPIKSCCSWFFWSLFGLAGLIGTLGIVFYYLMLTYEPFDELGDVCEYFRALFPETYECGCMNL
ncbi:hypothetical protein MPSEU_000174000 [Mayamaea pseudoterrestris]|nr:hypothetical protein MPSEU_000174000 [Mayamaea pseudoterrestris]